MYVCTYLGLTVLSLLTSVRTYGSAVRDQRTRTAWLSTEAFFSFVVEFSFAHLSTYTHSLSLSLSVENYTVLSNLCHYPASYAASSFRRLFPGDV